MEDIETLLEESTRLLARNEEIRRLKLHPKFRIVIPETVKEYNQLTEEEASNLKRVQEIGDILNGSLNPSPRGQAQSK